MSERHGYIRIRTPDDPPGQWTAESDIVPGHPYVYASGDVAVEIDWLEAEAGAEREAALPEPPLDVERLARASRVLGTRRLSVTDSDAVATEYARLGTGETE